mmetsp:Transcript_35937/g.112845  ORF Transcript_35937/g.112845 Transcript_35937/m.112845 type:complete len:224 (+) Transcript_35937:1372-2043(+)
MRRHAAYLNPALLKAAEAHEVGLDGLELAPEQRRRGHVQHAHADALDAELRAGNGAAVALLEAVSDADDALHGAVDAVSRECALALNDLVNLVREGCGLPAGRLVREEGLEGGARAHDAQAGERGQRAAQERGGAELHPARLRVGHDDNAVLGQQAASGEQQVLDAVREEMQLPGGILGNDGRVPQGCRGERAHGSAPVRRRRRRPSGARLLLGAQEGRPADK